MLDAGDELDRLDPLHLLVTELVLDPEPKRGERTDLLNNSTSLGFDKSYLSQARTVLRYSVDDDLAKDVMA